MSYTVSSECVKAAVGPEGSALFTWSGGKDSALALYEALGQGVKVAALLTTVTKDYGRVSMHGVREELLAAQAEAIGLPLEVVYIGVGCTNTDYEAAMAERLSRFQAQGVSSVLFGDIFLEDLRQWREERLAALGLKGEFPIWKRDTLELAHRFIDLGFRATLTCVDTWALPARFCGREFDEALLAELPPEVDPCGENGEFHTFVHDGPLLSRPVRFRRGEVVKREDRFCFCDLRPA